MGWRDEGERWECRSKSRSLVVCGVITDNHKSTSGVSGHCEDHPHFKYITTYNGIPDSPKIGAVFF